MYSKEITQTREKFKVRNRFITVFKDYASRIKIGDSAKTNVNANISVAQGFYDYAHDLIKNGTLPLYDIATYLFGALCEDYFSALDNNAKLLLVKEFLQIKRKNKLFNILPNCSKYFIINVHEIYIQALLLIEEGLREEN
jgi:hypothetical protein